MLRALKTHWILLLCLLFVAANLLLTAHEQYWLALLPVALIIGWAAIASVDKLLLFVVFATPLSINLEQLELGGIGISLPTEPLMVGMMLLFLLKLALERNVLSAAVLRHPVSVIVVMQLIWMAVCIIPSEMPVVSIKYLLARLWFVSTMYFIATRLFDDPRNMHRFFWSFVIALGGVIVYTLVHHAQYRFEQDPAHWVMTPFFKDHTSYGAVIAMVLPFLVSGVSMPGYSRSRRGAVVFLLLLFTAGLVFSYTRAAWVSLAGAGAVFLVMRLRIPLWVVGTLLLTGGGIYLAEQDRILIALERNRDESSDDLAKHVSSISNISSDASNLERINRWHSALRMFQERPVFGWGPGTYMFQYAPFQASEDRTIISTNFGLQGNAHSEYLGPLAEQGLFGMLLMVALVVTVTIRAMLLFRRMPPGADRHLMTAAFLGLFTYFIHGALNNFLDTDKASVPFWGFTAMVVLLDIKYAARRSDNAAPPVH
ncbi:MAG: O-antigen ligase family protein [Flavobacteriales bacterium]|nr:O-antigen ligase family protein [Flavobacteriales bacterium]MCB9167487.1 O-antigen ligase family protein [Flavobacteriales bacterium]